MFFESFFKLKRVEMQMKLKGKLKFETIVLKKTDFS